MALDASLVHQLEERQRVALDLFACLAIALLSDEKLVDLSDVAVGVRSERDAEVAHLATDAQLWQLNSLALKRLLA